MTAQKLLEGISGRTYRRQHEVFRSFVTMVSSLVTLDEARLIKEREQWEERERKDFELAREALVEQMEARPFTDMLGELHMEWGSKGDQQWHGEFYSPTEICRMMARCLIGDASNLKDKNPVTLMEPACGSGRMMLAAAEALKEQGISPQRLAVTCIDTSDMACDMTIINLTLWGIPARVIHGNALSNEVFSCRHNLFWTWGNDPTPLTEIPVEAREWAQVNAKGQTVMEL
jgi:type I restriction-modification system DNA methylase subunit